MMRYGKYITNRMRDERTFAEYFAGIGLMRLGLEREGWNINFANDIDYDKYRMYEGQFSDAKSHFILGDIHNIAGNSVPYSTLATASFPCNDLSLAGARSGLDGKHSSAYWGFIRILEEMGARRPPLVLLENVAGFLSSNAGEDFNSALLALNKLGYAVDPFIIDASHFVPQSRVRLFVVAKQRSMLQKANEFAGAKLYQSNTRPKALIEFISTHPDIYWNIKELPDLPTSNHLIEDIVELLPLTAPEWWDEARTQYLLNQMSPKHTGQIQEMALAQTLKYGTVFRRVRNGKSMAELRVDGTAGCLRTPRGGSGRQILIQAGNGIIHARLLTPRECARLMGADDYKINVSANQALFGFGDAVCVPVISWIARNYLNPLMNERNLINTSATVRAGDQYVAVL